jgi:hypothetical protein
MWAIMWGQGTDAIDAQGRLVLPGFIDSHNHLRLGSDADCVQLAGAGSLAELRARISAWLAGVLCLSLGSGSLAGRIVGRVHRDDHRPQVKTGAAQVAAPT